MAVATLAGMQFRKLRQILQQIVVAGLPVAGCDVGAVTGEPHDECTTHVQKTLEVTTPADAPMQLRIDSCRVDVDACPELCSMTMQRDGIHEGHELCLVSFTDDLVEVTVSY